MLNNNILDNYNNIWVAFSGGVDSCVLLDLLVKAKKNVKAVHINHNLQKDSKKWEQHCKDVCEKLNVDLKIINIKIEEKNNIEEIARTKRYKAIAKAIDGPLFLAHHADDQVETILLRLLRGAGPEGLLGIKEISHQFGLEILRPLLKTTKKDILQYAKDNNLSWVEDNSNFKNDFDRNFLRNEIIPKLNTRWGNLPKIFENVSSSCSEVVHTEELLLTEKLSDFVKDNIFELKEASFEVKRQLIRLWLKNNKLVVSRKVLDSIMKNVVNSKIDANAKVKVNSYWIRKYSNKLYLIDFEEKINDEIILPVTLREHLTKKYGKDNLTIRFWQKKGERIVLDGYSKSLKKYFQELGIPPWERTNIPLLFKGDQCVALIDRKDFSS